MKRKAEHLFVYGTLRGDAGDRVSRHLKNHTDFIGNASFQGKLFDVGGYPGAVPSDNPYDTVQGEVLLVRDPKNVFRKIDEYEGYNAVYPEQGEYHRQKLEVMIHSGKKIHAWLYVYALPVKGCRLIASGDYVHYLRTGK